MKARSLTHDEIDTLERDVEMRREIFCQRYPEIDLETMAALVAAAKRDLEAQGQ